MTATPAPAGTGTVAAPSVTLRRGPLSWRLHPRTVTVCVLLGVLLLVVAVLALGTGSLALSPARVVDVLLGRGDTTASTVVTRIRAPRVLTGILVGACLGVAGAVLQSLSRNPLGSPDVIGFTAGAATGAVVQIVLVGAGPGATAAAAVGAGVLTALVVYGLSVRRRVSGSSRIVLVGIGVGAVLEAVTSLVMSRGDIDDVAGAQVWLAGSVNGRTWDHVTTVAVALVLVLPVVLAHARHLDLLAMGDDTAQQLGARVERTRLVLVLASVTLAAAATAAAGPIAFVALGAPQLVLRLTRSPRVPVLSAGLLGAVLLVATDLVTQRLPFAAAVPIGLMTGLLGGVYLLWLLTRPGRI
ncbi:iron chelate uptake ABC transporter family permease subunit [Cellulomonas sp. zg-ZUI222]|uniref:Iron chelate uptake ABC transporter family permease subunit n=1 Tax=Cellulomonas wangleii TaxID=2816956 RepID=A0ABX8D696_9CELL|nr:MULTISPECIES: iron chelate uptake ABC transporter family permease subunit [Cellulomonas]MBO0899514.1 iron chelate uptake ABC transporter family permease subunit [Cellulomonas sp. zg-ZUI22]MBO0920377.1 iron chelate uptake ABC transporter family permease subunit [Cellulomonas wangleii]MBO0923205.1 iron chelate uptake ABC transporter family permease subunit [Cellulomonas wangleii]QVI61577.1 iron chelate uptake ABC transporter family permease subunit [Cellulomonas wangleii]